MADPFVLTQTVFAGLSALAAIVQAYQATRSQGRSLSPSEVRAAEREAESEATKTRAANLLAIIDDDVLEVMKDNIETAKDRLKRSLSDPANDEAAKDHALDIANSVICAELSRIKRLNGGALPGPDYERWWRMHGCA